MSKSWEEDGEFLSMSTPPLSSSFSVLHLPGSMSNQQHRLHVIDQATLLLFLTVLFLLFVWLKL